MKRLGCIFILLIPLLLTACGAEADGAALAREEARLYAHRDNHARDGRGI